MKLRSINQPANGHSRACESGMALRDPLIHPAGQIWDTSNVFGGIWPRPRLSAGKLRRKGLKRVKKNRCRAPAIPHRAARNPYEIVYRSEDDLCTFPSLFVLPF
ncbi:hypothetical protein Trydic_g3563 [Trypoxylus dichotomus]